MYLHAVAWDEMEGPDFWLVIYYYSVREESGPGQMLNKLICSEERRLAAHTRSPATPEWSVIIAFKTN